MPLTKIKNQLIIERQKINALLEITNAVNKNYKVKNLLAHFEYVMRDYIGIPKLAFINKGSSWKCILKYGINKDCEKFDINEMTEIKTTTLISDTDLKGFEGFDVMLPVYHKEKPLSYLLLGGIKEEKMLSFIQTHVGFVQTLANIVSVAIESKALAKQVLRQKLEEKDMEMAAEMQKLLLPSNLPSNHYIDISATYIAKNMVSGDYYDFIPINEDDFVFCIADVSGKGMSAAMLMSNFQATLRANVKYNHSNLTLKELIEELNVSVINSAKGEKFITFFIGYFKRKTRELKYLNAGHNYPVLTNKNIVKELNTGCTALGIFNPIPTIETETIVLEPNTVIVCYTDGMIEVENEKKEQYQTERLKKVIKNNSYLNMNEMNKALFRDIDAFKGENSYPDDTAILSLRII